MVRNQNYRFGINGRNFIQCRKEYEKMTENNTTWYEYNQRNRDLRKFSFVPNLNG